MTHDTPKTQQKKTTPDYHQKHHLNVETQAEQSQSQIVQSKSQNINNSKTKSPSSETLVNLYSSDYYQHNFPPLVPLPVVQPVCNTLLSDTAELISSSSNVLYENCDQPQFSYNAFERSSPSYSVTKL